MAQFALSGNEGTQGQEGLAGAQGEPGTDGADEAQGAHGDPGTHGDSHWLLSNSNTYFSSGNVGIGTSSPSYQILFVFFTENGTGIETVAFF